MAKEITDVELRRLADNLGSEWQKLATFLGFKHAKIQQFELDHYSNAEAITNTVFSMLVAWRERQPTSSNFREIMKIALEKCDRVDLADSILPESPMAKLDEIYALLKGKLQMYPEQFQDAITKCHEGMFSCKTDLQLSQALADMGKYAKGNTGNTTPHQQLPGLDSSQQPQKKTWKLDKKFNKVGEGYYSKMTIHDSGDIGVLDKNGGEYTAFIFSHDGSRKFELSSNKENPKESDLRYPEGIAGSHDGHYLVTDASPHVKIFDVKGQFIRGFATFKDEDQTGNVTPRLRGITISRDGDVLVGDLSQNRVTVHDAMDYTIKEEIYISIKPDFLAVNNRKQVYASDTNAGKVICCEYAGDQLFTITPKLWGDDALPAGVLWSESDDTILLVLLEKRSKEAERLMRQGFMVAQGIQNGHVHQYNSHTGEFMKCIIKGLLRPWGISMRNNVLAVANSATVNVYNTGN